jgi:2-polyprenyl-3-methyl-5-hydroxy-6-metoxy-1,4-benzoquinol methylase
MKKKYIYSKLTTGNKSSLKRFSHNKRFVKALELSGQKRVNKILDFGTGDGYFLNILFDKTEAEIFGYEPVEEMFYQLKENIDNDKIELVLNLNEISEDKFNVIYCLEVLEHFYEDYQKRILNEIKDKLKSDGIVIISVPIEVGTASLIKNSIRVLIKQFERDTNFKNILKAFTYKTVNRQVENNYVFSHIGFNYKKLEKIFDEVGFSIVKKDFSPFSWFKGLNSQVFFVLKLK